MHFGENQLSRSLIGLSPLHTGHPPGFQPWWVRVYSTRLIRPIQTRFPYGYPTRVNLATHRNSQAHSSKGTQSPRKAPTACKHTVSGTISRLLTGVLFIFPSRYLFTIG